MKVQYDAEPPNVSTELENETETTHTESKRGDPDSAFASAPVQLDELYGTPAETHNPMEMHATVAVWDGKGFTLYESSQGVVNHQHVMAQVMGVEKHNLRVISRYIGSGFGGKLFPWPHSALAAAASRQLNRPVKLTLSRRMMFADVGHRPETRQRMRLGATHDGKLLSLAPGLSQSHLDAGQHQGKLWRGDTVPVQHGKSAGHVGTRQKKRRNSLTHARSRSRARTFCGRIRHG